MSTQRPALFDRALVAPAIVDAFRKLSPAAQWRNPVMFVVYVGSVLTTLLWVQALFGAGEAPAPFIFAIGTWLWFTLLFANFAEALAEGRSKAQAASLRSVKTSVAAKKLSAPRRDAPVSAVSASDLRRGDVYLVEANEVVPADGEAIAGAASVDESAITGESAPVIREAGGDFSSVTGGTRLLSDWLVVRVSANPGESFLDRMIAMVEGAKRQKTPNEIALTILLVVLTLVFLLATATLLPFSIFSASVAGAAAAVPPSAVAAATGTTAAAPVTITVLVALLVCLIPTTIGGLLSAVGVAGMGRMLRANVIAKSGRAVEAAGDVDVLLLDKTGTITIGSRQASAFVAAPGVDAHELVRLARLASLADETPEGRSIVALAGRQAGGDGAAAAMATTAVADAVADPAAGAGAGSTFVPFSAATRMSGVDMGSLEIRKGSLDAIRRHVADAGGRMPSGVEDIADGIARRGSTPLVVVATERASGRPVVRVVGVVELKDIVKPGLKERFAELRRMGIRTVMITGDNRLTAAAIAAEAGVDDFLAEATPEMKLQLIRDTQADGRLVAMTGDGTNDAPALAQADVAVAMNSGTQPAKEAGNMVDLDSNPTKLIEVVEIGKQMLMTRGSLTTFSIANDVAKYFAIIPAAFAVTYPQLKALDVMGLHSPESAILSAVVFNALIIVALIPLALRGVRYRALGASALLRRNVLIYGVGGLVVPFVGIKCIDLLMTALRLV